MSMPAPIPDLLRVSGRHRNRALALAQARQAKAVQLRTAGYTYQEIADRLGYANRGAVHNIVSAALSAPTTEAVDFLRRLQSDRLDALARELWPKADNADIRDRSDPQDRPRPGAPVRADRQGLLRRCGPA